MQAKIFGNEPRPEELIAEIYRQYSILKNAGKQPLRVYISINYLRRIRIYHALMGAPADQATDYLGSNHIFGMDFYIHELQNVIVSE